MYVVTVEFVIDSAATGHFMQAMTRQADNSVRRERGCERFDVCTDPDEPRHVFLYEVYRDRAAFDAHLQSAHFRSFDEQTRPWIVSKELRMLELKHSG